MILPPSFILSDNDEIQLQPATLKDLPSMAEIFVTAHDAEVTVYNQMKDVPRSTLYQYYTTTFTSMFEKEEGVRFWKIVQVKSGTIIGVTCWHHPSPISTQEHYPALPSGSNESLCEEFFGKMEAKEKRWFAKLGGGEEFFMLHYIAVMPSHSGKGIGAWAIRAQLQEADRAGKKTFLIGTPRAQRLYARLGFEEVDCFEIDLAKRNLKGENHWAVMVREPRKESS